jgi:hypothetical protein
MFFISVAGFIIICATATLQCVQAPDVVLSKLILGGTVELAFEIGGIIKLFRLKDK